MQAQPDFLLNTQKKHINVSLVFLYMSLVLAACKCQFQADSASVNACSRKELTEAANSFDCYPDDR